MKQRLVLILVLTLIAKLSHSQVIDRYGINIGTSYSTQFWDFKLVPVDIENEYKFGFQAFIQAENDIGNLLALRTEFGYIQKGFKNTRKLRYGDGTSAKFTNDNVILHDLALNIGLKIKPLKADHSPYILAGLRGDYMISYKDIEFEEPSSGLKSNLYGTFIEDFNKFNLGGLIGMGISITDLIYFEVEYNPNFTKNFDTPGMSIEDNCWGVKIGMNINKLND